MNKREKRKQMQQRLQAFQGKERKQAEQEIYQQIFSHMFWQEAAVIATTMSMPIEIDTKPIIERAWIEGKRVALPVVNMKTKEMTFHEVEGFHQLEKGTMDILEPSRECQVINLDEQALCIVPGLAFTKGGYRLGFGGGFYDRFLTSFQGKTVALAFHFQRAQDFPVEVYDVPVDLMISNTKNA